MKLWRVNRAPFATLDGEGARLYGSRYAPAGARVASLASDAALAVLIALRYQPADLKHALDDLVLGWTETDAQPLRVPDSLDEPGVREWVGEWLTGQRSLLAAVRSRVLPEGDVVLLNPAHPAASSVPPLITRPFSFADTLHRPPLLDAYGGG